MAGTLVGEIEWSLSRSIEGHRTYTLKNRVVTNDSSDGPTTVLFTPGLPQIGSYWQYGNDIDVWAFCTPATTIEREGAKNESDVWWMVTNTFTTEPLSRCADTTIEDPLLEPDRLGGSFVKYTREATKDRYGNAIVTSANELMKGPAVEFDANRPSVWIEQNVATLGLETFTDMIDKVNTSPMWGLQPRMVKLTNTIWERRLFGTCSYFFTRTFEFDINFETFDRTVLDEGTQVLKGAWGKDSDGVKDPPEWEPDTGALEENPQHTIQYLDIRGNPASVILDGSGNPWDGTGSPGERNIEYYDEREFFLLGIPAFLG